jgi:dolichyl-phosphate-mannose--protein O-mannosyl transferase
VRRGTGARVARQEDSLSLSLWSSPAIVDHYIPDLLVGVLHLALCVDTLWAWALPRGGSAPVSTLSASRARLVAVFCAALGVAAILGYVYWGIPFVHGMRLSDEEEKAREWHEKWSTRLPPGVVDTSVGASFDR